ncbi:MAG TPA: two-component regulator propeller domain-containing protein [Candidatus Aminicenantes bacterium]|nr:two-component regulator propeller domain-containing protein [Candidatus Aminicenantes bacterium]
MRHCRITPAGWLSGMALLLLPFMGRAATGEWLVRSWTPAGGLPHVTVYALCQTRDDFLWLGTEGGLARFDGNSFTRFGPAKDLQGHSWPVTALLERRNGVLIAGTFGGGLWALRGGRLEPHSEEPSGAAPARNVWVLLEDSRQNLWVGTAGDGLLRYDRAGRRTGHWTLGSGLPDDTVTALDAEMDGTIWVGTRHGACRLDDRGVASFATAHGLPGETVTGLHIGRNGALWLATPGGLCHRQGERFVPLEVPAGFRRTFVRAFAEARDGVLFLATERGLYVLDGERVAAVPAAGPASDPSLLALCVDRDGHLWLGSSAGGLSLLTKRLVAGFPFPDSEWMPATSVAVDPRGRVWAGVSGGGWRVLDRGEGRWRTPAAAEVREWQRSGPTVAAGKKGWRGGVGELLRLRQGGAERFPLRGGWFVPRIFDLAFDATGDLWLVGNAGLGRIRAEDLRMLPARTGSELPVRWLGEEAGLDVALADGAGPGLALGPDGRLWAASARGAVAADPAREKEDRPRLRLAVSEAWLDDHPVPRARLLRISGRVHRIELRLSAPLPAAASRVSFRYRLAGVDPAPRNSVTSVISYRDLPAGDRLLTVVPLLDGVPAGDELQVKLRVLPVPSRFSGWIWSMAALALALSGLAWRHGRKRRDAANSGARYRSSTLSPRQAEECYSRLLGHMEREKPHLEPDLTVAGLAVRLEMPAKHLSQVIHEQCDQNFNEFVNSYRTREAMRRLTDPRLRGDKLLKIAFECGFNSKTVFHEAFKKQTGFTPAEFRRRLGTGPAAEE